MLSYRTIEPNTLELLNKLSQLSILSDMRLVGETSLALQYGHRKSVDLDFLVFWIAKLKNYKPLTSSIVKPVISDIISNAKP